MHLDDSHHSTKEDIMKKIAIAIVALIATAGVAAFAIDRFHTVD